MSGLALRGMRPVEELGAGKPHGERLRYLAGCRCFYCRRANSDYERERAIARANGDWNGLVDAQKARGHLLKLRKLGVGRRAVHLATDVSDTVLQQISTGRKKRIRGRTERLILAVTADAAFDGAYVNAARTWKQVRELLNEGFTKRQISAEIGQNGRSLQLGTKRVSVKNAAAVDRMWRRYMTPSGV